ncbi:RidA family protein [Kitasatospora brasiliensis]|uniref:RidA family protein n=1 Tax=Kitasatospora brasiliensis TaxID=3058040 RepID=UPI00292F74B7|nr:RidA family protein [Kitasatospora sp. K002]
MSSAVKLIRDTRLTSAVDYAYAAEVDAPVRSLWLAGACPLDEQGRTVAVGDFEGQAHQVMRNLITTLEDSGAALTDIVRTTVYVASGNQADLGKVWSVYREYLGEHDAPSTLLGVTVLGYHDQLVEVEAVAVLPA